MAFAGPTVGEQRSTAELNHNIESVADMLASLKEALARYSAAMDAHSEALKAVAEAIGNAPKK
jgi:hypothetical protein